jgi:hypothetical protein
MGGKLPLTRTKVSGDVATINDNAGMRADFIEVSSRSRGLALVRMLG